MQAYSSPTGLYLHIPYCRRKCPYCSFYSLPVHRHVPQTYIKALLTEAEAYRGKAFQTLFIGGGTPSLLGRFYLKHLIDGLKSIFHLSGLQEATIEVNPESTTHTFLQAARDSGITRLSIGVQTLQSRELAAAGRQHTPKQALDLISRARETGFSSISADMIVGLPGQRKESLINGLEILIKSDIDHLSLYCLSLDPQSPMALSAPLDLPTDDDQAEWFEESVITLKKAGFDHYELSNFARPGHHCLHNVLCWRGESYLGIGAAAASHLEGVRSKNCSSVSDYLEAPGCGKEEVERLELPAKAAEETIIRLRLLMEGVNLDSLEQRFTPVNVERLKHRLKVLAHEGFLVQDRNVYRLHPAHVLTSNVIFRQLL